MAISINPFGLEDIVEQVESGGNPNAVSDAGAEGTMQTMPRTQKNPGYGVKPAQDDSPEEKRRVGRDYLNALRKKYKSDMIAVAAYNAGPGTVNKWLQDYGDPRSGGVSDEDWVQNLPYKETKDYIHKISALSEQGDNPFGKPEQSNPFGQQPALKSDNPFGQDTTQPEVPKTPSKPDNGDMSYPESPLLDRTEGTLRQIGGVLSYPAQFVAGIGSSIGTGLAGGSGQEMEEARQQKMGDISSAIQGNMPTNPVIDQMGKTLSGAADLTIGGMKAQAGLPLNQEVPGEGILHDTLQLLTGLKGGKDYIEGKFKRVPNDDVTPALTEQKNFEQGANAQLEDINQKAVDQYNANPKAYGVDDSEAFNPFGKGVEEPSPEPTLLEKHQDMVNKGNEVINRIQDSDISPQEVESKFWKDTYPNLPEEIQSRFGMIKQKVDGEVPMPSEARDLTKMSRWYVALMHEANEVEWGPKAKLALDNKLAAQDVEKTPDTYVDRLNDREMEANPKGWSSAESGDSAPRRTQLPKGFFSTNDPTVLKNYFDVVAQNRKSGDLNNILSFIKEKSNDPFERLVAGALLDKDHPIPYTVSHDESPSAATTYLKPYEPTSVTSFVSKDNAEGISSEVLLHEGTHALFSKAVELGRDDRTRAKYPEYARFFDDVSKVWLGLQKILPQEVLETWRAAFYGKMERQGSMGQELLAYGWTNPELMGILDQVRMSTSGEMTYDPNFKKQGTSLKDFVLTSAGRVLFKDLAAGRALAEFKKWQDHMSLKQHTALDELKELMLPMAEFIKKSGYDAEDVRTAMNGASGWIQNNVFDSRNLPKNVDLMAEAIKKSTGSPSLSALPKEAKEMVDRLVSPYSSWEKMRKSLAQEFYDPVKYKDMARLTGAVYPVNKVKNLVPNPIPTYTVSKLREIYGDSTVLRGAALKIMEAFHKLPKADQNQIVTTLNQINRPENQDVLKGARSLAHQPTSGPLTDQELQKFGLNQQQITAYRSTLEPLFATLLQIDQWMIKYGFDRDLTTNVIGYFPRSFGYGKFTVSGHDPKTGKLAYYHRFPSWAEAKKAEDQLSKSGLNASREAAKDWADFKGHLMGVIAAEPDSGIAKVADNILKAVEEYKRTQEFERNARGVAGFVGQNIAGPKEVEQLKMSVYARIEMTVETYRAVRLLREVLRPFQEDELAQNAFPNTYRWVNDIIRRELGSDISQLKWLDDGIQWVLNQTHITYLKAFTKLAHDLKPGELTIDPSSARDVGKYIAASGSAYVLFGNVPNLVTNAFTIPLVSMMGGLIDAPMFKGIPAERKAYAAIRAHTESVADMVALKTGTADKGTKKFIERAKKEGWIEANMFSDIPITRKDIEKSALNRLGDKALNIPRKYFSDQVEIATNYMCLLYYHRFVQHLLPQLSTEKQYRLAVDMTKSYTGDYAPYNKALMWDKMGVLGQPISNFSIWTGTRLAQFHEVLKNAVTKGLFTSFAALAASSILVAGLEGVPLAPDYEKVRVWLHDGMNIDLPPMDLALKEAEAPDWLRQGVALNSTGYDLATRGKWAGWTDLGGVGWTMPSKAYHIFKYFYLRIEESIAKTLFEKSPVGPSNKDAQDFVNALPSVLKGTAQDQLMSRNLRKDEQASIITGHDNATFTQTPEERGPNLLGFKSTRQAEQQRNFYAEIYKKNQYEEQIKGFKDTGMDQLIRAIDMRKAGKLAQAYELQESAKSNFQKYAKLDPSGFNNFSEQLLKGIQKESDTPKERLAKQIASEKNPGRLKMLKETLTIIDQK